MDQYATIHKRTPLSLSLSLSLPLSSYLLLLPGCWCSRLMMMAGWASVIPPDTLGPYFPLPKRSRADLLDWSLHFHSIASVGAVETLPSPTSQHIRLISIALFRERQTMAGWLGRRPGYWFHFAMESTERLSAGNSTSGARCCYV